MPLLTTPTELSSFLANTFAVNSLILVSSKAARSSLLTELLFAVMISSIVLLAPVTKLSILSLPV